MKTINLILLLSLSINVGFADDILLSIDKQLAKTPITLGKFQQEKQLKFLSKPLISKGQFAYHQNQGVIWQTQSPVQSTLVINDSTMLTGTDKQSIPPAFADVFRALLGGDINRLSQNFTVTGKQQNGLWTLELKPKDEMLKKIINMININGDQEVRSWELQETGGNQTRILFSDAHHPDRLPSELQADFEQISP